MPNLSHALSDAQIASFIADGFVRIDNAFPTELADECRAILWKDTGVSPDNPATWTKPVIRLGMYAQPPFRAAANTEILRAAYDQLVGKGRWLPPQALGTFPVRFPSPKDPGDAGWHVDVSFGENTPDFMEWRANVSSKGRQLLMLFLFSEIGDNDAPTRIRAGSHLGICHPFLVHAAQPHRGTRVKFMAQPPLLPAKPLELERADGDYSPVEIAIRTALER
jgi:hypothetical protein